MQKFVPKFQDYKKNKKLFEDSETYYKPNSDYFNKFTMDTLLKNNSDNNKRMQEFNNIKKDVLDSPELEASIHPFHFLGLCLRKINSIVQNRYSPENMKSSIYNNVASSPEVDLLGLANAKNKAQISPDNKENLKKNILTFDQTLKTCNDSLAEKAIDSYIEKYQAKQAYHGVGRTDEEFGFVEHLVTIINRDLDLTSYITALSHIMVKYSNPSERKGFLKSFHKITNPENQFFETYKSIISTINFIGVDKNEQLKLVKENLDNVYERMVKLESLTYDNGYLQSFPALGESRAAFETYSYTIQLVQFSKSYLQTFYEQTFNESLEGDKLEVASTDDKSNVKKYKGVIGGETGTGTLTEKSEPSQDIANMQVNLVILTRALVQGKDLTEYFENETKEFQNAMERLGKIPLKKLQKGVALTSGPLNDGIFGKRTANLVQVFKKSLQDSAIVNDKLKPQEVNSKFTSNDRKRMKYLLDFFFGVPKVTGANIATEEGKIKKAIREISNKNGKIEDIEKAVTGIPDKQEEE